MSGICSHYVNTVNFRVHFVLLMPKIHNILPPELHCHDLHEPITTGLVFKFKVAMKISEEIIK